MNIKSLSLGIIGTNCYILAQEEQALIIDPGGDAHEIINYINHYDLQPQAILLTHAHFDHIGAVDEVRDYFGLNVYIHENERDWLVDPALNGSEWFTLGHIAASKRADGYLNEGSCSIGSFSFQILHTLGHSPGSVSFWFEQESVLIAGDTLFQLGIGRTDLPFGNHDELIHSINTKLLTLPDETTAYPGHGPQTTIGVEKMNNPFLRT
ncbi:MBL fold metallo-hydrolase [Alkalibacillus almallahensis]|uniref:MBL fold metallo-hydrolase n=1 Tax=Alkalibacillus almallahensis TaxID=1379154 RepID=UPI0014248877|nr:glyoxylase-like metal-dependent hydrolase (beta-lactamase superfamily II) [Alkalibacillus almallahensis]